jgi:hypothetical protein
LHSENANRRSMIRSWSAECSCQAIQGSPNRFDRQICMYSILLKQILLSRSAPNIVAFGKYSRNALSDAPGTPPAPMLQTTSRLFVPTPISRTWGDMVFVFQYLGIKMMINYAGRTYRSRTW